MIASADNMAGDREKTAKMVGSVLVVGGGIAGMQASLDCADAGFKVCLLEQQPSIGGNMAMLDKTFPTNDCAMCMISPKLVDVGRHPNIELITYADLMEISGEAGHFKVRIRKRSRYVDLDKCTGCGECVEACNVEMQNEFDLGLGKRKAIYRLYPQAIPNAFTIHKKGIPPCQSSCPTGVNIQGFVALIRQKKYAEALALYKEKNPFPGICGRICHYPCENECNRGKELDEPIASRHLHRFLADLEMKGLLPTEVSSDRENTAANESNGKKVAIVGSGPAGLTVAYDLTRMGYRPTVFEALPVTGGMLRVGIPRYRLPEEVLDYEIEAIRKAGVEIKTNTPVGPDLTLNDLFEKGHEAIFIAIGTHRSRKLNIEGEDLEGVIHGTGFLQHVETGKKENLQGKVVAVVGGGNVALDSVRTALRLGAKKALVIYRRSKNEMPAFENELEEAEREGMEIHYLTLPKRILGAGNKVVGMECVRMELGEPDETGRRRPLPIEGSEFTLDVDVVIPAVSQSPDLSLLDSVSGLKVTEDGVLPVEGVDLEGVRGFTDFLREASLGHSIEIGRRTVVIGGGNVAIDVARTAIRLGCREIHLTCLEKRDEMPAFESEVEGAEQEGVVIHNSLAPVRIVGKDGRATGVKFVECTSVFDSAGNFDPKFKEDAKSVIEAETVIVAIGQVADYTLLKAADGILVTKADRLAVDDISYATNMRGVFAGGDVIGGPALALNAIAQGHEAAISIDRFIRGEDLRAGREKREPVEISETPKEAIELSPREVMRTLSVEERIRSFNEVELGFTEEQALAEAKRCLDCGGCCRCMECVKICKVDAVDHEMKDQLTDLNVGAIIMANGYEIFDPLLKSEYGFGRYPNVVTSLQFERILSASGPYEGHLKRPSDGRTPQKIAWIQCVGSRDVTIGNDYCSSVCCMYAVKEAMIAKEHDRAVEPTIFFTDLRAFGKGFEAFYNRAKGTNGVRFVRSQVSSLKENPENGNIIVRHVDPDSACGVVDEEFDMVVLSVGMIAHHATRGLASILGVSCDRFGFAQSLPFDLSRSNREGVFLSGAVDGPKDIPDTIIQSSAAAALCGEYLAVVRGTEARRKEYPPEKDCTEVAPRIGVFVCHCGTNIASTVDVEDVIRYARTLGGVAYAQNTLYTCSQDSQEMIKNIIREKDLNRVIVASCTPRTHEPLFRETMREAGLNEYMFEMVNIREQCSWVHQQERDIATAKAKALVRGGVGKAHLLEPLHLSKVPVTRAALVVGGGITGMSAALSLARQGFHVHLVEKEAELGGNLRHIKHSLEGYDWQAYLRHTISEVMSHRKIMVHLSSEVDVVTGFMGNFTTKLRNRAEQIQHGVIVVATGAEEWQPNAFLYGEEERVITQRRLEEMVQADQLSAQTVVMIQCVGSRNDDHEYCSRVCCGEAIKNALTIKQRNPAAEVYILYRDIRTYEFREQYYRQAREKGVMFIHFPDELYPKVSRDTAGLTVKVFDDIIGEEIDIRADLLVLAAAIAPQQSNTSLATALKVPLDKDGFFMEAHIKLRPVDFANTGIFVCGLAHSPKYTEENISQALAAAGRAACILAKESLEVGGVVAAVDPDKCASCLTCVHECAYNAPFINADGKAEIEAAKCQGCGNCAAACPAKAIQLATFTDKQEEALFHGILEDNDRETHQHAESAVAASAWR